jgi:hypothetical protein
MTRRKRSEEESKNKDKTHLKNWLDFNDEWYLSFFLYGCVGILVLHLLYRKLTNQAGTWDKNMSLSKIYSYNGPASTKTDSAGEVECRRYLETVFQAPFPKARPNFLRNPVTGNNLEIDCFNEALKLGVEYNGRQHYAYASFFHRNVDAATNQKYRDELKRRMCRENGIVLIEVPYTIKLDDIGSFLNLRLRQWGFF